ncbi:putative dsRNA-binding protein [Deinococcus altitudinis]|uniref:putative dsRNA-binding protein n=1 Tax=Deinococcus altitudinis TaxID=468914 RepID=UPI0038922E11
MPSKPAVPDPSNAKGELIAACRNQGLPDPTFQSESGGPGHAPWFRTVVLLGSHELGTGEGRSKRDAERAASLEALRAIAAPDSAITGSASTVGAATATPQPVQAAPEPAPPVQRWPIYADVLREALLVAHERNEDGPPTQVAREAAELYRRLLGELGHTPETP